MTHICIGAFVAATFITTLVFMMNESVANGAPDNEQTRGMITSLWFMSENIAGYLGRYEMFIILYILLCIPTKCGKLNIFWKFLTLQHCTTFPYYPHFFRYLLTMYRN